MDARNHAEYCLIVAAVLLGIVVGLTGLLPAQVGNVEGHEFRPAKRACEAQQQQRAGVPHVPDCLHRTEHQTAFYDSDGLPL